jgi:hypothetical protein
MATENRTLSYVCSEHREYLQHREFSELNIRSCRCYHKMSEPGISYHEILLSTPEKFNTFYQLQEANVGVIDTNNQFSQLTEWFGDSNQTMKSSIICPIYSVGGDIIHTNVDAFLGEICKHFYYMLREKLIISVKGGNEDSVYLKLIANITSQEQIVLLFRNYIKLSDKAYKKNLDLLPKIVLKFMYRDGSAKNKLHKISNNCGEFVCNLKTKNQYFANYLGYSQLHSCFCFSDSKLSPATRKFHTITKIFELYGNSYHTEMLCLHAN